MTGTAVGALYRVQPGVRAHVRQGVDRQENHLRQQKGN